MDSEPRARVPGNGPGSEVTQPSLDLTRLQCELVCDQAQGHSRLCEATQGQRRHQVGSNCPRRRRATTHAHVHSVWDRLPLGAELKTIQHDTWGKRLDTHTGSRTLIIGPPAKVRNLGGSHRSRRQGSVRC